MPACRNHSFNLNKLEDCDDDDDSDVNDDDGDAYNGVNVCCRLAVVSYGKNVGLSPPQPMSWGL